LFFYLIFLANLMLWVLSWRLIVLIIIIIINVLANKNKKNAHLNLSIPFFLMRVFVILGLTCFSNLFFHEKTLNWFFKYFSIILIVDVTKIYMKKHNLDAFLIEKKFWKTPCNALPNTYKIFR
jgi:hypothetical protein